MHVNANRYIEDTRPEHRLMVEQMQPQKLAIAIPSITLLRKTTKKLAYILGDDERDMPYAQK